MLNDIRTVNLAKMILENGEVIGIAHVGDDTFTYCIWTQMGTSRYYIKVRYLNEIEEKRGLFGFSRLKDMLNESLKVTDQEFMDYKILSITNVEISNMDMIK